MSELPPEAEIDALYRLPLAEFVAARNALAKKIGGGAQAKFVKALAKPTVVPWAVNQLYWRARPAYDQLLAAGRSLREAQIGALEGRKGAAEAARRATDAHRKTLDSALIRALRVAASAGERPADDEVRRVLETLSLAPTHPEKPGRLTTVVRPAGFEALAGVTPVAEPAHDHGQRRESAASPATPKPRAATQADAEPGRRREGSTSTVEAANRRAQQEGEVALAAARAALSVASAEETRAKEAMDRAAESYERTRNARRAAEQALRRLQG